MRTQNLYRDNRSIVRRVADLFTPKDPPFPKLENSLICLGRDRATKQEIWIGAEQITQHMLVLGTTGAGKTENLLSIFGQSVAYGGGGCFVDGKGDIALYSKLKAIACDLGREEDLYVLNFMSSKDAPKGSIASSNTIDLFSGDANGIVSMLLGTLDELGEGNEMWRGRANALLSAVIRALVWMRDEQGAKITLEKIREMLNLRSVVDLAGMTSLPPMVRRGVVSYLTSLPGYQREKGHKQAQTTLDQHGFLQMQFTPLFSMLSDAYGHIFSAEKAEIDLKDIVLNHRVLLVLLPALSKSNAEVHKLGQIITSLLRSMMSERLGVTADGTWANVSLQRSGLTSDLHNATPPFLCVFDECATYLSEGMALLTAQARSLNIGMIFSAQDIPQLKRRFENEAMSITANTNTKIFMRTSEMDEIVGVEVGKRQIGVRRGPIGTTGFDAGEFILLHRDEVVYGEALFAEKTRPNNTRLQRYFSTAPHVESVKVSEARKIAAPPGIRERVAALFTGQEKLPSDWLDSAMSYNRGRVPEVAKPGGHHEMLLAMRSVGEWMNAPEAEVLATEPVARDVLDMMSGKISREELPA